MKASWTGLSSTSTNGRTSRQATGPVISATGKPDTPSSRDYSERQSGAGAQEQHQQEGTNNKPHIVQGRAPLPRQPPSFGSRYQMPQEKPLDMHGAQHYTAPGQAGAAEQLGLQAQQPPYLQSGASTALRQSSQVLRFAAGLQSNATGIGQQSPYLQSSKDHAAVHLQAHMERPHAPIHQVRLQQDREPAWQQHPTNQVTSAGHTGQPGLASSVLSDPSAEGVMNSIHPNDIRYKKSFSSATPQAQALPKFRRQLQGSDQQHDVHQEAVHAEYERLQHATSSARQLPISEVNDKAVRQSLQCVSLLH